MRIAVIGAGGIGGLLAGRLMACGEHDVALLARGAHLAAIRDQGLTVKSDGETLHCAPRASDDPAALGAQDLVVVTVKAHDLPALARGLTPMLTRETKVLAIQNGIPWWYFYGADQIGERPFETVDPEGRIWSAIGPHNALGGVIAAGAEVISPGVVLHTGSAPVMTIGAPKAGEHAGALCDIAALFTNAGCKATITDRIRQAIWRKQEIVLANGPISVLTGTTVGPLESDENARNLRVRIMRECLAVANAWGMELDDDAERRAAASGFGQHRPSMLQDFLAGRPLELDSTLAAAIALGAARGVDVPMLEAVLALVRLRVAARDGIVN